MKQLIVDGEVIATYSDDTLLRAYTPKQLARNNDHKKRKQEENAKNEALGGFVFFRYKEKKPIMTDYEISLSSMVRLFVLSTYSSYKQFLYYSCNGNLLNENNINNIIGLSQNKFKDFVRELYDNNIIIKKGDKIYLNENLFWRGSVDFIKESGDDFTRVYINPVRDLYNSFSNRQHKSLNILFRLIPYLHFETNEICKNPSSPIDKIEYMTLKQIAQILSYSTTQLRAILNKFKDVEIFGDSLVKARRDRTKGNSISLYISKNIIYRGSYYP